MRCNEFEQRLNHLLDLRQDPRRDAALVHHADECSRCARLLTAQLLCLQALSQDSLSNVSRSHRVGTYSSTMNSMRPVAALVVAVVVLALVPYFGSTFLAGNVRDSVASRAASGQSGVSRKHNELRNRSDSASRKELFDSLVESTNASRVIGFDQTILFVNLPNVSQASKWLMPVPEKLRPLTDSVVSAVNVLWNLVDGSDSKEFEPQARSPWSIRNHRIT